MWSPFYVFFLIGLVVSEHAFKNQTVYKYEVRGRTLTALHSNKKNLQPKPTLHQAPEVPLMPFFVGYKGSSIKYAKQVDAVKQAQQLALEIGQELQRPSQLSQSNTLTKFNILTRVIRILDAKEIQAVSREIFVPQQEGKQQDEKASARSKAWKVLRDSVAQAGTGPALVQIKEWIKTKQIQGKAAAEVIAALPRTVRTPTSEYLEEFFQLAISQDVQRQAQLNSSALLSVTQLVYQAQLNKNYAHNYYPICSFAQLIDKQDKFATSKIIPYLTEQLQKAVQDQDSHKILVYIRAIGNLGYPQILSVFEPYLEGKKPMTSFQRMSIVIALDQLIYNYPTHARSVLFKIYQNSAEAHQVRCAAVFQIMRTKPPASMLQRMAAFTNVDPSTQVRAAVKSSIQSIAKLKTPQFRDLASNAKAAEHLLTPETLGLQYSTKYIVDYVSQEMNSEEVNLLAHIGSDDSLLPSALFLQARQSLGGFNTRPQIIQILLSSVKSLQQVFVNQWESEQQQQPHDRHQQEKKSSERKQQRQRNMDGSSQSQLPVNQWIQMLNILPDQQQQLEGSFALSMLGTSRFFAYNNQSIEQLPQLARQAALLLRKGHSFNYTKLYNQDTVTVAFPLEMGLPFVYTLKVPTLVQLGGEIRAHTHPNWLQGSQQKVEIPQSVEASAEVELVLASMTAAEIGFVTPFDHQRYVAGYNKKQQVYLPLGIKLEWDLEQAQFRYQIRPLHPKRDIEIYQAHVEPYTVKMDILQLRPIAENYQFIHIRKPKQWQQTYGQQNTGMAFHVQVQSEAKHSRFFWLLDNEIALQSQSIHYNGQQSNAETATFAISYIDNSKQQNRQHKQSFDNSEPSTDAPDSKHRQQEFLQKVSAGLRSSSASVWDMSVQFKGQNKAWFVATVAVASGPVEDKSRVLFFYGQSPSQSHGQSYQICMSGEGKAANAPTLNIAKALQFDASSQIEVDVAFGENCKSGAQVRIKTKAQKSNTRKLYLRKLATSYQCETEMNENNSLLPICQNMTIRANQMDRYTLTAEYKKLSPYTKNAINNLYSAARVLAFPYLTENIYDNKQNKLEIEARLSEDLQSANIKMHVSGLEVEVEEVPIPQWIAAHPDVTVAQRYGQEVLQGQYQPTCMFNQHTVNSFDNKTFETVLGQCWHVAMTTVPESADSSIALNENDKVRRMDILVRDAENQRQVLLKEMIINAVQTSGDTVQLVLKPSGTSIKVMIDGQQKRIPEDEVIVIGNNDDDDVPLFKVYQISQGVMQVEILGGEMLVQYDGMVVKIMLSDKYRNVVRGLCGTLNGEQADDFVVPKNCIIGDGRQFAASYALTSDNSCRGPAKELQERAKQATCYARETMFTNVVSEFEAGRSQWRIPRSSFPSNNVDEKYRQRSSSKGSIGLKYQTQYVQKDLYTCFTLTDQPACQKGYKSVQSIDKLLGVHCLPTGSHLVQAFVMKIFSGGSLQKMLANKSADSYIKFELPQACEREN